MITWVRYLASTTTWGGWVPQDLNSSSSKQGQLYIYRSLCVPYRTTVLWSQIKVQVMRVSARERVIFLVTSWEEVRPQTLMTMISILEHQKNLMPHLQESLGILLVLLENQRQLGNIVLSEWSAYFVVSVWGFERFISESEGLLSWLM